MPIICFVVCVSLDLSLCIQRMTAKSWYVYRGNLELYTLQSLYSYKSPVLSSILPAREDSHLSNDAQYLLAITSPRCNNIQVFVSVDG